MGFSKGAKIALAATALTAALTVWALTGRNQDSPVNIPPASSIEDTILPSSNTTDNTTTPKEQYSVLDWSRSNTLKYQNGATFWEANIANGVEEAVRKMTTNPKFTNVIDSDFNIKGAFVDEKNRYVVAWGDIREYPFGKISFRDVETGEEKYAYWLNRTDIDNLIPLYNVPTNEGFADYAVIVGDTARVELLDEAIRNTGVNATRLPVIEILQLTDKGPVALTYNPIVQEKSHGLGVINGKIVNIKVDPARDKAGNVTLNIEMMTYTKPEGSSASVALKDILKLGYGVPIIGRFMP